MSDQEVTIAFYLRLRERSTSSISAAAWIITVAASSDSCSCIPVDRVVSVKVNSFVVNANKTGAIALEFTVAEVHALSPWIKLAGFFEDLLDVGNSIRVYHWYDVVLVLKQQILVVVLIMDDASVDHS